MGNCVEVSLTKTLVQPEAGADASALPIASGDGAIFDALMVAVLAVPTTGTGPLTPPAAPEITDPATQALATDMEQMVQALAITAQVVVKGLTERAPQSQIKLKIEPPTPQTEISDGLPDLSVMAPLADDKIALKVTITNGAENLDPEIVARLMTAVPVEPAPIQETEIPVVQELLSDEALMPALLTAPQSVAHDTDLEAHGPFRVEIHGPFISPDKTLIAAPLYVVVAAPFLPDVVSQAQTPTIKLEEPDVAPQPVMAIDDHIKADVSPNIRDLVVKIQTPLKPALEADLDAAPQNDQPTSTSELVETPDKQPHTDTQDLAPVPFDASPNDLVLTQNMPQVQPHFSHAKIEQRDHDDVLQAPQRHWEADTSRPALALSPSPDTLADMPKPSVRNVSSPANTERSGETWDFDASSDDGFVFVGPKAPVLSAQIKSEIDTNIPIHVANSSARSSSDIRNIVKLGVHDIEIIQSSTSGQAEIVSPTTQILTRDLTTSAPRAGISDPATEAVARDNQSSSERRTEAHDIRMRAIERQVIAAAREGTDTIRMQLYPPGLGQVMIRLTMEGARLKLSSRTSTNEATESLRGLENDLREALATSGLELTGFDVSEDNQHREGHHEQHEQKHTMSRSAKPDSFALDMNA